MPRGPRHGNLEAPCTRNGLDDLNDIDGDNGNRSTSVNQTALSCAAYFTDSDDDGECVKTVTCRNELTGDEKKVTFYGGDSIEKIKEFFAAHCGYELSDAQLNNKSGKEEHKESTKPNRANVANTAIDDAFEMVQPPEEEADPQDPQDAEDAVATMATGEDERRAELEDELKKKMAEFNDKRSELTEAKKCNDRLDFDTLDDAPSDVTTADALVALQVRLFGHFVGIQTTTTMNHSAHNQESWGRAIQYANGSKVRMRVWPKGLLDGSRVFCDRVKIVMRSDRADRADVPTGERTLLVIADLFDASLVCPLMQRDGEFCAPMHPPSNADVVDLAHQEQLKDAHHVRTELVILPICRVDPPLGVAKFMLPLNAVTVDRTLSVDANARFAGGIFSHDIAMELMGSPESASSVEAARNVYKEAERTRRWSELSDCLQAACGDDALLATGVRTISRMLVRKLSLHDTIAYSTMDIARGARPDWYVDMEKFPALIAICTRMALSAKSHGIWTLSDYEERLMQLVRSDWLSEVVPVSRTHSGTALYAVDAAIATMRTVAMDTGKGLGGVCDMEVITQRVRSNMACMAAMGVQLIRSIYAPLDPESLKTEGTRENNAPEVFAFELGAHDGRRAQRHAAAMRTRNAYVHILCMAERYLREYKKDMAPELTSNWWHSSVLTDFRNGSLEEREVKAISDMYLRMRRLNDIDRMSTLETEEAAKSADSKQKHSKQNQNRANRAVREAELRKAMFTVPVPAENQGGGGEARDARRLEAMQELWLSTGLPPNLSALSTSNRNCPKDPTVLFPTMSKEQNVTPVAASIGGALIFSGSSALLGTGTLMSSTTSYIITPKNIKRTSCCECARPLHPFCRFQPLAFGQCSECRRLVCAGCCAADEEWLRCSAKRGCSTCFDSSQRKWLSDVMAHLRCFSLESLQSLLEPHELPQHDQLLSAAIANASEDFNAWLNQVGEDGNPWKVTLSDSYIHTEGLTKKLRRSADCAVRNAIAELRRKQ